jgi:hypothetical protein
MESISVIEAVRKATDPFGMNGTRTAACRPQAVEVIERLAELGFVVAPRAQACTSDDPRNHQGDTCPVHEMSESEKRFMWGDR